MQPAADLPCSWLCLATNITSALIHHASPPRPPLLLQVARRKGPDGKLLSMGYGFVETDSEAAAKTAIKQLQVRLAHSLRGWQVLSAHITPSLCGEAAV